MHAHRFLLSRWARLIIFIDDCSIIGVAHFLDVYVDALGLTLLLKNWFWVLTAVKKVPLVFLIPLAVSPINSELSLWWELYTFGYLSCTPLVKEVEVLLPMSFSFRCFFFFYARTKAYSSTHLASPVSLFYSRNSSSSPYSSKYFECNLGILRVFFRFYTSVSRSFLIYNNLLMISSVV